MRITIYDPPAGWQFGFPRQYKPLPNETLEETLKRDGYPEKLLELSKWTRFWDEEIPDETIPSKN